MSLYAQYIKEREGVDTLETESGFVTYKFRKDDCYIIDVYVIPEMRRSHLASSFADQIAKLAKEKGYKFLTGSVDKSIPTSVQNASSLVSYGFRPFRQENNMIYFVKELT